MFLFVSVLPLFACPDAEYASLCERLTLCSAKPTVELFVATIFQFSARLSVKDLLSYAAGSDDAV